MIPITFDLLGSNSSENLFGWTAISLNTMGKKTAAILSLLIAGLGQFYAGHLWRAVAWLLGSFLIVGVLTVHTGIVGLMLIPLISIGCAWDAYNLAK